MSSVERCGFFWGTHGCSLGEHEGPLHRCELDPGDLDDEMVEGEGWDQNEFCSEYDEATGKVRHGGAGEPWMPHGHGFRI
jgi:hypothetical protein